MTTGRPFLVLCCFCYLCLCCRRLFCSVLLSLSVLLFFIRGGGAWRWLVLSCLVLSRLMFFRCTSCRAHPRAYLRMILPPSCKRESNLLLFSSSLRAACASVIGCVGYSRALRSHRGKFRGCCSRSGQGVFLPIRHGVLLLLLLLLLFHVPGKYPPFFFSCFLCVIVSMSWLSCFSSTRCDRGSGLEC